MMLLNGSITVINISDCQQVSPDQGLPIAYSRFVVLMGAASCRATQLFKKLQTNT